MSNERFSEVADRILMYFPNQKIEAIKNLRSELGIGLKEAKDEIEAAMARREAAMTKKDEFILFVKMYDYSDPIEYKVSSKEEARNVIEVLKKAFSGNIYDVRLFQEVFNF